MKYTPPVEELLDTNIIELMYIITNSIIPLKGYVATTIYPFIFTRGKLTDIVYTHEHIHAEQQKELLIIFFLILYGLEYIIKLIITFNTKRAYRSISFEQEAYRFECDKSYLDNRKHYNWIKYIFKLSKYGS